MLSGRMVCKKRKKIKKVYDDQVKVKINVEHLIIMIALWWHWKRIVCIARVLKFDKKSWNI